MVTVSFEPTFRTGEEADMAIVHRRHEPSQATPAQQSFDPMRMLRELSRFDPFQEMEQIFGLPAEHATFLPDFEVKETKDCYDFKADVPGVKEGDLEISVTGNRLAISGRREAEEHQEGETYYAVERSYGTFTRTFTLPEDANADGVRAELKDGVLSLAVPKKAEKRAQKVTISTSAEPKSATKETKH